VKERTKSKSMGSESTFYDDIESFGIISMKLKTIAKKIISSLHKGDEKVKTITIKIKYTDFILKTRSKTLNHYTWSEKEIIDTCIYLLKQEELLKPIRLLGVSLSNFESEKVSNSNQQTFDF
jgi:DNA polymerase-4